MKTIVFFFSTLVINLFVLDARAAIAVRGSSSAYYQSATIYSAGATGPSIVGVGAATSAASGNVTPALPAGIVAGDLLLCMTESHDNVAPAFPAVTPAWSRLYRNRPGTEYSTIYFKSATAAETNPLITHTAGGSIIAQCAAVRGAGTPTMAGVAGTGSLVKTGSVTTTSANELMLLAAHLNQGATTTAGWTVSLPSGLTWTPQFASTTTLGTGTPTAGSTIGLWSAPKPVAGAQATVNATIAGTVNAASLNYGALIRIPTRPAINKPAATVAGDLMLLSIAARSRTAVITPPAGWSLLLSTINNTNTRSMLNTYYKFAGASEPSSYAWGSSVESVAGLVSFSGVDTTTPFDTVLAVGAANTASTTTQIAPTITPVSINDWLVTVHEITSTPCPATRTNGWTFPTGMTEQVDVCSRVAASNSGMGMEVNTLGLTTAVATGAKTATAVARAARGISQSMVLRPYVPPVPHHIRIEHDGLASNCAPESITIKACSNATCTAPHYTTTDVTGIALGATGTVTWSPVNNQTITAVSGGINGGITLSRTSATTATLSVGGTISPTPSNTYECYNTATGTSGDCSLAFSDSLSFNVPDHTAGTRNVVSITSCATAFSGTNRTVKFWSTYSNPATGTLAGNIVAGTGNVDCSTGYSALSKVAATPTPLNLSFTTPASPPGASPQATFTLCYPDVGLLRLDARYDGAATNLPVDTGVVKLGNDIFTAIPDHFDVTSIKCTSTTVANCGADARAMATAGDNPAAADAAGGSFMRAGDSTIAAARFTATVTAKNARGATTPNFGLEATPEGIILTPELVAPPLGAGTSVGVLTCKGSITACVVPGGATSFTGGVTTITDLAWNEVGILKVLPKVTDGDYLTTGKPEASPTASSCSNIGRFFPGYFEVTTDPESPVIPRAAFGQTSTTASAPVSIGATTIDVADAAIFKVGGSVRIPRSGVGGGVLVATVTDVNTGASTITLNSAVGADLLGTGSDNIYPEWGSYIGERMDAQFTLSAMNLSDSLTVNYQGGFAKLDPTASGNPLGLGAMNATATPTYGLALDTSLAGTGNFSSGVAGITLPLAIVRSANPVGPYNLLKIGIAPSDADGVVMGGGSSYNLGIASTISDHTSIMNPLSQEVTAVRYGRSKVSNVYGSELLPLQMPIRIEYWNGTAYTTSVVDDLSILSYTLSNDTSGGVTIATVPLPLIASGIGQMTLMAPGSGSVDVTVSLPAYLPGTGRATFGLYKGSKEFIYMREAY